MNTMSLSKTKNLVKRLLCPVERKLYLGGIMSTDRLTLPHFLGLGSGQSGSTWLHDNLSLHPDIFLPAMKEVHYFSRRWDEWPISVYASYFAEGSGKLRGEITPGYNTLRRDRIADVYRLMPEVRLILIMRNPVDRAWSAARRVMSLLAKEWGSSIEAIDDSEFFEYFQKEWAYRPEREMGGDFEPGLLEGQYSKVIDNWLSFYPSEQLLVLFFDDLKQDPEGLITRVCEHIGVDPQVSWDLNKLKQMVNRNPSYEMPARFRSYLNDVYQGELEELQHRFGEPIKRWRGSGKNPDAA